MTLCACLNNECCADALVPGFRCRKAKGGDAGTSVAADSGPVVTRNGTLPSNERSLPEKIATRVVEAVCELPDYNSPDDQPDLVMCTVQELKRCVLQAFEQLAGEPGLDSFERSLGMSAEADTTHERAGVYTHGDPK
jgi:hypothetical protein